MDMDKKGLQLFNILFEKIQGRTFEEIDIHSFYILLRSFAKENLKCQESKWLLDLGDLIAHRNRNQGYILDKLFPIHKFACGKETDYEKVKEGFYSIPPLNVPTIKKEFDDLLLQLNKAPFGENLIKEILLYTFSLLQFSSYEKEGMRGKVFGYIDRDCLGLIAKHSEKSYFYCLGRLDIAFSIHDFEWWKNHKVFLFDELQKKPFYIKRNKSNEPLVILGDWSLRII